MGSYFRAPLHASVNESINLRFCTDAWWSMGWVKIYSLLIYWLNQGVIRDFNKKLSLSLGRFVDLLIQSSCNLRHRENYWCSIACPLSSCHQNINSRPKKRLLSWSFLPGKFSKFGHVQCTFILSIAPWSAKFLNRSAKFLNSQVCPSRPDNARIFVILPGFLWFCPDFCDLVHG